MTYQRREEIFSKEALRIKDIQEVYEMTYESAARMIREMKARRSIQGRPLRLNVEGYIHTLDYLEEIGLDASNPGERYCQKDLKKIRTELTDIETAIRSASRSVCI